MLGARGTRSARDSRHDASDESDVDEAQTADWMMDLHGTGEVPGFSDDDEAGEPGMPRWAGGAKPPVAAENPRQPQAGQLNDSTNRAQRQAQAQRKPPAVTSRPRLPRPAASQDQPSRVWLIPLGVPPEKLFGKDQSIINSIERQTNTYLKANIEPAAVFMWGTQEQVAEAVRALEIHANHILDELRTSSHRTKGWEKPEKPLSERKKRREELKKGKKDYHGVHPEVFSFSGVFMIPSPESVRADWLRRPEVDPEILKLREEAKCWIFLEDDGGDGQLRVIGEKPADVEVCLSRIKNLFIQRAFKKRLLTLYMLECPSEGSNTLLKFTPAPIESTRFLNYRSKSVLTVIKRAMQVESLDSAAAIVTADQMKKKNLLNLSANIKSALEDVRLWQGQTRMRISFGHLICSDYPEPNKYPAWQASKLSDKVLPHHSFKAQFCKVIAERETQVDALIAFLRNTCAEYAENPRNSYELLCCDRVGAAPCDIALREGQELPPQYGHYRVVARFRKDDGKLASWDAEEIGVSILKASYLNTNSPIDWRMDVCTSIPLPADSKSAHGFLCWNLRLNIDRDRGERLIYHHTANLAILQITRKRTWTFARGDWVIEITREEEWPSVAPVKSKSGADSAPKGGAEHIDPQCTLKETPSRTFISVQLHHRSWDEELASQLKLGPGEPARWDAEALAGHEACISLHREIQEVDENIRRFVEFF